jgi:hypothetical protein
MIRNLPENVSSGCGRERPEPSRISALLQQPAQYDAGKRKPKVFERQRGVALDLCALSFLLSLLPVAEEVDVGIQIEAAQGHDLIDRDNMLESVQRGFGIRVGLEFRQDPIVEGRVVDLPVAAALDRSSGAAA